MTPALATVPKGPGAPTRLFLDVERSVTGRAWRDRLDERATARALAIAQRSACRSCWRACSPAAASSRATSRPISIRRCGG